MKRLLLCVLASFAFASQASAGVIYGVRFETNTLNLTAGSSATVNVFFDETESASNSDPRRLDLASSALAVNGLTIANFAVASSGAGMSSISAAQGNALFDVSPPPTLGNPTTVEQATFSNPPVFGFESGIVRSVLLGSVTVTASGLAGQSNVFRLQDFSPSDDFILDDGFGGLGFVADGAINFDLPESALTVNVIGGGISGVPEPSSALLLGLLAGAGGWVARRRNAKKAVVA